MFVFLFLKILGKMFTAGTKSLSSNRRRRH